MPDPEQDNPQGPTETESAEPVDDSATEQIAPAKSRFEELQQQLNTAQKRRDELSSGPFAKLRGNDRPLDQEIDRLRAELEPMNDAVSLYGYMEQRVMWFRTALDDYRQTPDGDRLQWLNSKAAGVLQDISALLKNPHLTDIGVDPESLTDVAAQINQELSAVKDRQAGLNRRKWSRRGFATLLAGGAAYAFTRSKLGHNMAKSYREAEQQRQLQEQMRATQRAAMPTETPTEQPTQTPETVAQTELQKDSEQLYELFMEIRADKDLAAEQAIFLFAAAKEHGVQPVIEFVKAINKKGGDSVDLDTAAMVASEALKAGKTPEQAAETIAAFSKLYSNKYKDEGLVAQMAVLSIKYNLEPQKVVEDYKNLHQYLNAAGTTMLQNIFYQGFSLDQIKESFTNVQKLTEHDHQQYDNGIDESIAAASLLSNMDEQKLIEQFKTIRHQIDADHDATAFKLALVTMAGDNTDDVIGQYRYVDKKLDDLKTDLQEASASQIVLNAVSDNSTIPGLEELANSGGGLDPNFTWSIYGPNGLSHP